LELAVDSNDHSDDDDVVAIGDEIVLEDDDADNICDGICDAEDKCDGICDGSCDADTVCDDICDEREPDDVNVVDELTTSGSNILESIRFAYHFHY
jgi:hypothetical protein